MSVNGITFRTTRTIREKRTAKWAALRSAHYGTVRGSPPGVAACPDMSAPAATPTAER